MKRRDLLIATFNQGKFRELRQMLASLPLAIFDLTYFPSVQLMPENGETFLQNATLKAAGYAKQTCMLTLADDSGLEVDALNGAPGVLSARYAGENASDADRTAKLLRELSGVPESRRTARFVSVIAVAAEDGNIVNISSGTCEGRIAGELRGTNGFGYDPVFVPAGFSQTFGELQPELKNRFSHRSQALTGAYEFLRSLTAT